MTWEGSSSGRSRLRLPRHGLLVHYGALVIAVLIPMLAVIAMTGDQLADTYRRAVDERLEETSHSLASAVDNMLRRHAAGLEGFAASPAFGFYGPEEMDVEALYAHAVRTANALDIDIVLIKPDFSQVFNTRKPLGTPLPKTAGIEPVKRAIETRRPYMSDMVFGAVAQRWVVGLAVPVLDPEGRPRYVLAAPFDHDQIAALLAAQYVGEDGFAAVTDRAHRVVARSSEHARFVGSEAPDWWKEAVGDSPSGLVTGTNLKGQRSITAYAAIPFAEGWRVVTALPEASYEAAWRGPLMGLLGGLALALTIALGVAVFLARQVQGPLEAMRRHARQRAAQVSSGEELRPIENGKGAAGSPVQEVEDLRDSLTVLEQGLAERDRRRDRLMDDLRSTLTERDLLLRELHHRVKNNLQQINALLFLESAGIEDPAARHAFEVTSERVRALATVHQLLIAAPQPSVLSSTEFLNALCEGIALGHGAEARGIKVVAVADEQQIHIERAIHLGLLVSELLTNALKHAFLEGEGGRVEVRYTLTGDGSAQLTVADDGRGTDDHFGDGRSGDTPAAPQAGQGAGAPIVRSLVRQFGGRVSVERNNGTQVTVDLPADGGTETTIGTAEDSGDRRG